MEIVGHRGASDDAPENTLESLMLAWEQGAYAAECDIILTRDEELVLMHDDSTRRTALNGIDLVVEQTDWEELKKLDVGSWKGEKWSGVKIPLLKDVLGAIPEGKHLFIEIKTGDTNLGADVRVIEFLAALIEKEKISSEKITFICFDHDFLNRLKKRLPHYKAFYLTTFEPFPGKWPDVRNEQELEMYINKALGNGIDGLDMENSPVITKEWVERIHNSGLKVCIWSYGKDDTTENARRYRGIGIDFLTTNMPAKILQIFKQT
jgi:glycerophosphoryl diester phosphodiesterase